VFTWERVLGVVLHSLIIAMLLNGGVHNAFHVLNILLSKYMRKRRNCWRNLMTESENKNSSQLSQDANTNQELWTGD